MKRIRKLRLSSLLLDIMNTGWRSAEDIEMFVSSAHLLELGRR